MSDNTARKYYISEENNSLAVITLSNNVLGGSQALEFSSTLHELTGMNVKHVLVDMKDVELINSSGLGMLVSGLSTLKKQEIDFILVNVPSKVSGLLSMTHLDKVFRIFDSLEEAVSLYS